MIRKGYILPDEALTARDITSTDKVILAFLINRNYNSGKVGGEDYTQPEIAEALHMSTVTINTSLKKLEELGYIIIDKVFHVNGRKRNVYRINWKRIETGYFLRERR